MNKKITNCGNCDFFAEVNPSKMTVKSRDGRCIRYPPHISIVHNAKVIHYVEVSKKEVCGEWSSK